MASPQDGDVFNTIYTSDILSAGLLTRLSIDPDPETTFPTVSVFYLLKS